MKAICAWAIPYLAGVGCAIELDKVWDLQTLEKPILIPLLVLALLMQSATLRRLLSTFPSRRSA